MAAKILHIMTHSAKVSYIYKFIYIYIFSNGW